jgi:hypothetical protein
MIYRGKVKGGVVVLEPGVQLPDGTDVSVEPLEVRQVQAPAPPELSPVRTGADLQGSDLIGIWADRTDIGDSREFARRLRKQASQRQGVTGAPRH